MQEKLAQLQAKFEADQSLVEKLFALETQEEVHGFLKEQGLEFSLEEIKALRDLIVKSAEKGELSEEDLEEVAGGITVRLPSDILPGLHLPLPPITPRPRW